MMNQMLLHQNIHVAPVFVCHFAHMWLQFLSVILHTKEEEQNTVRPNDTADGPLDIFAGI